MVDLQTHFIFPTHAVSAAGPLPAGAKRLSLEVPSGDTLRGVHIASKQPSRERTLILGFAGNGWNAQHAAEYLHELYPETDVVAFHYRGYRPSTGSPSAEALMADAPLVYDLAVERVKPHRIVGVGLSIGSGIAAQLSAERKLDGLILVTPFDSLKALARSMYPWLPVGPFLRHEIDASAALQDTRTPVAIIAAERDEIVRRERTDGLRERVPNLVFDRTLGRAGHNDIYSRSDFHQSMREALTTVVQ